METFELLNLKAFLIEVRGLHLRPDLSLERRHPIVQPAFVLQAQPLLLQFESAGMTIRHFHLETTSILGTEFLQTTILFVAELRFEGGHLRSESIIEPSPESFLLDLEGLLFERIQLRFHLGPELPFQFIEAQAMLGLVLGCRLRLSCLEALALSLELKAALPAHPCSEPFLITEATGMRGEPLDGGKGTLCVCLTEAFKRRSCRRLRWFQLAHCFAHKGPIPSGVCTL